MLAVSGLVSGQNAQTIIDALDELGNFANVSKRSPLSEGFVFSKEDLLDIGSAGDVKDVKDTQNIKDRTQVKDATNVEPKSPIQRDLSVRKQGIIGVLRSGQELGIRDIAANLPEYSEKMIQRELLALVLEGKVKKLGFKRWSRYTLISA
jgi:hypothetical protein